MTCKTCKPLVTYGRRVNCPVCDCVIPESLVALSEPTYLLVTEYPMYIMSQAIQACSLMSEGEIEAAVSLLLTGNTTDTFSITSLYKELMEDGNFSNTLEKSAVFASEYKTVFYFNARPEGVSIVQELNALISLYMGRVSNFLGWSDILLPQQKKVVEHIRRLYFLNLKSSHSIGIHAIERDNARAYFDAMQVIRNEIFPDRGTHSSFHRFRQTMAGYPPPTIRRLS